jgi:hypothetical protein
MLDVVMLGVAFFNSYAECHYEVMINVMAPSLEGDQINLSCVNDTSAEVHNHLQYFFEKFPHQQQRLYFPWLP